MVRENLETLETSGKYKMVRENLENLEKVQGKIKWSGKTWKTWTKFRER